MTNVAENQMLIKKIAQNITHIMVDSVTDLRKYGCIFSRSECGQQKWRRSVPLIRQKRHWADPRECRKAVYKYEKKMSCFHDYIFCWSSMVPVVWAADTVVPNTLEDGRPLRYPLSYR